MEKKLFVDFENKEKMIGVTKALSNHTRLEILELLSLESLSVDEISKKMNLPLTSVASNITILENVGLIRSRLQSGKHGTMKLCSIVYESISLKLLNNLNEKLKKQLVIDIPLGSYYAFDVKPTCGLVSDSDYIGKDDDISTFYRSDRFKAQLLWFHEGYIEYRIPVSNMQNIIDFSLSMEICSEAPNYRNFRPSDITLLINDVDVGTWKCPGDFGGRKGLFTPDWWPVNSTQFGLLKTWSINDEGTFIDFVKISNITTEKLFRETNSDYISIKIMIKDDAKNIGGINIFGERFGDYPQNILLKLMFK